MWLRPSDKNWRISIATSDSRCLCSILIIFLLYLSRVPLQWTGDVSDEEERAARLESGICEQRCQRREAACSATGGGSPEQRDRQWDPRAAPEAVGSASSAAGGGEAGSAGGGGIREQRGRRRGDGTHSRRRDARPAEGRRNARLTGGWNVGCAALFFVTSGREARAAVRHERVSPSHRATSYPSNQTKRWLSLTISKSSNQTEKLAIPNQVVRDIPIIL
jgi:hypothetical protein